MSEKRKLAAIMFTDIVGYTTLMSKDEHKALDVLQRKRDTLKPFIAKYNGEFLKEIGDGTLSSFTSAVEAVTCAIAIQRTLKDEPDFNIRIGIHIGDVVIGESDVFGDGVNVAARIEPLAEPGGISVSEKVYDDVKNKSEIETVYIGEKKLKNVDHPIKVYAIAGEGLPAPVPGKTGVPVSTEKSLQQRAVMWQMVAVIALLAVIAVWFLKPEREEPNDVYRYSIDPPQDVSLGTSFTISPDGKTIAYIANNMIYIRQLDELESTPVPGTENANQPFFKPDGKTIGFFDNEDGKLKRVNIDGKNLMTITSLEDIEDNRFRGAIWGDDGKIIYSEEKIGLRRVHESSGDVETLTFGQAISGINQINHLWPQFLPDQKHVLFTYRNKISGLNPTLRVCILSLETMEWDTLIHNQSSYARYISPEGDMEGYLMYVHEKDVDEWIILSVPFECNKREISGEPQPIQENIRLWSWMDASFAVSETGNLVYLSPGPPFVGSVLVWVDKNTGEETIAIGDTLNYKWPKLSPDGEWIAMHIDDDKSGNIYTYDTDNGEFYPITTDGDYQDLVWSHDGKYIYYTKTMEAPEKPMGVYRKRYEGSGLEELISPNEFLCISASTDGKYIAGWAWSNTVKTLTNVIVYDIENDTLIVFDEVGSQASAQFSPDGKWIAYTSEGEIYIQPYPPDGTKNQITTEGGSQPYWRPDGKGLFFRVRNESDNAMYEISFETGPPFRREPPEKLFDAYNYRVWRSSTNYDYDKKNERFLMVKAIQNPQATPQNHISVVVNFIEELKELFKDENK
ncbi:adenylate/guanylate cyclase domain-containing protein [candidate division KSB1 bacterium]